MYASICPSTVKFIEDGSGNINIPYSWATPDFPSVEESAALLAVEGMDDSAKKMMPGIPEGEIVGKSPRQLEENGMKGIADRFLGYRFVNLYVYFVDMFAT